MTTKVNLLRPNTFFLLLLRAGKSELGQSTGWAESNGLTESNLIADLIRVGHPGFFVKNLDTLKSYMSGFKSGDPRIANSETYFPFSKSACRAAYMKTMSEDIAGALSRFSSLAVKYLDLKNGANKELLVGGIIEYLQMNPPGSYLFNIGDREITVSELSSVTDISLFPFLLSVWYYVVTETPDSRDKRYCC